MNSNEQYFADVITTPNNVYHDRKDGHASGTGTYIADAAASYVQLDFDSRDTPDANAFRAKSDLRFDNRLQTNAYGVDSLTVPLPDGMDAITVKQPRNAADGPLERESKFAWKADWYIEVDLGAVGGGSGPSPFGQLLANLQSIIDTHPIPLVVEKTVQAHLKVTGALDKYLIPDPAAAVSDLGRSQGRGHRGPKRGTVWNDGGPTASRDQPAPSPNPVGRQRQHRQRQPLCDYGITHTRSAQGTPTSAECQNIFYFNYDKWYEGRELRYVDVVDVNVGALQNWASGTGKGTSIVYITVDGTGGSDPNGDGVFPVIRLINAATLTDPITFATNHPLYVQGHYNTGIWNPSALVGDALTFLSTVWDDAAHQDPTVVMPKRGDHDRIRGHHGRALRYAV